MKWVLALVLVAVALPVQIEAFSCYSCSSSDDAQCGDPQSIISSIRLNTCESNGYCMKVKIGDLVTRSCAPLLCVGVNSGETGTWCCSSDKCNSSSRSSVSYSVISMSLLLVASLLRQGRLF